MIKPVSPQTLIVSGLQLAWIVVCCPFSSKLVLKCSHLTELFLIKYFVLTELTAQPV